MAVLVHSVFIGLIVALAGTVPRNLLFGANLRFLTAVPWAVPLMAAYLWLGAFSRLARATRSHAG